MGHWWRGPRAASMRGKIMSEGDIEFVAWGPLSCPFAVDWTDERGRPSWPADTESVSAKRSGRRRAGSTPRRWPPRMPPECLHIYFDTIRQRLESGRTTPRPATSATCSVQRHPDPAGVINRVHRRSPARRSRRRSASAQLAWQARASVTGPALGHGEKHRVHHEGPEAQSARRTSRQLRQAEASPRDPHGAVAVREGAP